MSEEKPKYITISNFAKHKEVPVEAVQMAINMHRLPKLDTLVAEETLIPIEFLDTYEFDLIGVYDYAERKGVTYKAVYKKIDKGIIKYTLEPTKSAENMKIDWNLFGDIHFRKVVFKHRGKERIMDHEHPEITD